jgi:hypothetical protein
MSFVGDAFKARFGAPDPATQNGLVFTGVEKDSWELELLPELGCGWFLDGFVYLFGDEVEKLRPCLDAWPFLVPPNHPDRMILGRNAYGVILTLENANTDYRNMRSCALDPINLTYWTAPGTDFIGMLGRFLPEGLVPDFLERDVYDFWLSTAKRRLPLNEVLGIKVAKPLGGEMMPSNFQPEDIVDYYRSLAPIYEKAGFR